MEDEADRLYYGSVQHDRVRLQYYRTGGEKPPVVFLHGFTDSGLSWSRLPLFLRHVYDVVLLDARGHGISSSPPDSTYSQAERAGDAFAVIEGLGLQRPVLIGHSMGADTAARVAADHPAHIRGLVLEDPPWYPQGWRLPAEDLAIRAQKAQENIAQQREKPLKELIELCREKYPQWDEAERFQWAKAKKQVKPQTAMVITQPRPDWQELLQQITCPILLATADVEAGGIVGDEVAEEAARLSRDLVRVHFAQAGHSIHRDQFYAFRDSVRTFLRQLKP